MPSPFLFARGFIVPAPSGIEHGKSMRFGKTATKIKNCTHSSLKNGQLFSLTSFGIKILFKQPAYTRYIQ